MDLIQNYLNQTNSVLGELLANPYVAAFISMFFILYASIAAPQLPGVLSKLFDNSLFKILVLAGILFVNQFNPTVAMLVAVAFFISLQTLSRHKMSDLAAYIHKMRGKKDDDEESNEEEVAGRLEVHDPTAKDFEAEDQVSGLAGRTDYYQGPQGMKHPVGFGGTYEGADIQY